MSDFPPLGAHLQWKLAIERSSLAYAKICTTKNVLFAVDIPYPLLRAWYSLVVLKKPVQPSSEATTSVIPNYMFVELPEHSIPGICLLLVVMRSPDLKSFGLQVESLIVSEVKSGVKHNLTLPNKTTDQASDKGFDALSDDDKSKVEKVLFLLDRFCVGDHFYHELSMVINGLPKSYLVKQRRDQLNKTNN
ncbi:Hypothetical predicted protein [Paramuricea clavata]|uniref:Uncharacterized protein n=1 Tax=Paramuricea clavata TaxID=317549 RepID=A0A7D9DLW7_PARCT|nr:Hypothetical predicted protein [Paramuricea clavata]